MNLKEKLYSKVSAYNKPVSEQDIRLFEQKYNILLPQELVIFYTSICNGCKMPDGSEIKKLEEWEINPSYIIKDFPFEDFWIWENDESYDESKLQETLFGNIELVDIGDCQTWNIIVQGKKKGEMWFFTDVGIQPCVPPKGMLEWIEGWLDGDNEYFGIE